MSSIVNAIVAIVQRTFQLDRHFAMCRISIRAMPDDVIMTIRP